MGEIPVLGQVDGHQRKRYNPEHIGDVHQQPAQGDKPEFMPPRSGEEQKEHGNLHKQLQTRASGADPDDAVVDKMHGKRIGGGNLQPENMAVYPQALAENHLHKPLGDGMDNGYGVDFRGKMAVEQVEAVGDDSGIERIPERFQAGLPEEFPYLFEHGIRKCKNSEYGFNCGVQP